MKREINVDFSTIFRLTKPAFFNYFSSVQFFFSVRKEGWSGQPKHRIKIYITATLYRLQLPAQL